MTAQSEGLSEAGVSDFVDVLCDLSLALVSYLIGQAHASKLGLTEYLVLDRACDEDGVTARDAGRAFDLNSSTMTGISDRLERGDLVRRAAHPTDRRLLVLKATPRGHEVIRRTVGGLFADLEQPASGLDDGQREALIRTLEQITDRLRQDL
ncbi:MAG: MarR family transcriptional regulator [Conexibacteraceae bacterium]|nr:MarR family transcriptional regulator [Conexibacteraceae bacterium]